METSTCFVLAVMSCLQLEVSVVLLKMLLLLIKLCVLMLVSNSISKYRILTVAPSPSVPPIFATITETTTTPTIGQSFTLSCTLSGVENTLQGSTYQWKKDGVIINGRVERTLSFSSLTLSDAGQYFCMVTLNAVEYSATKDVSLQGRLIGGSFNNY